MANIISKIKISTTTYDIIDTLAHEYINSITTDILSLSTLKANIASPVFTGMPSISENLDSSLVSDTTLATIKFVNDAFKANDAMIFKGTIGTLEDGGTIQNLPTNNVEAGWTYKVITEGFYTGISSTCEVGDMIICTNENPISWSVIQSNIDGAVTGPIAADGNTVAIFNGTSGKIIADSHKILAKNITSEAALTDTKYTTTTTMIGSATVDNQINIDGIDSWDAGTLMTTTKINTSEITAWDAGTSTLLGTPFQVKGIDSFSTGTLPTFEVNENGVLILDAGVLPSLNTESNEIPNVIRAGTAPILATTAINFDSVATIGTLPTLTRDNKNIPNISVVSTTVLTNLVETITGQTTN